MTPEEYLTGHPLAQDVFDTVRALTAETGAEVRTTTSQIAFRRRRGFAFLWLPGRYLAHPTADVVLSVDLGRHDDSPRWKEVAHPAPGHWLHHLEIHALPEVDDEVAGWLREAAERAA